MSKYDISVIIALIFSYNIVVIFILNVSAGLRISNWQKEMQVMYALLATVLWLQALRDTIT